MPGTLVGTNYKDSGFVRRLAITCTADAANGSFPSTNLLTLIQAMTGFSGAAMPEGQLFAIAADVGATAPTEGWGLALTRYGADILDGQCASMPAVDDQVPLERPIVFAGGSVTAASDPVTIDITGNSVNSAVIVLYLYWAARVS